MTDKIVHLSESLDDVEKMPRQSIACPEPRQLTWNKIWRNLQEGMGRSGYQESLDNKKLEFLRNGRNSFNLSTPCGLAIARDCYAYQPIVKSNTTRLLTLFPGTKGSTIQCELQELRFVDNWPSYNALSYVWGNPDITRSIRVHGKELQITTNLESALQSMRSQDKSRLLWVDAICIDQGNLAERNEQVQMMTQIYSQASSVLVWLGNHDSVNCAFNIIKRLHRGCSTAAERKFAREGLPQNLSPSTAAALPSASFTNPDLLGVVEDLTINDYMHLKAAFWDNSWWSRAWVLQEFIHARKVDLVCDVASMSWDVLDEVINSLANDGSLRTIPLGYTLQHPVKLHLHKTYGTIDFSLEAVIHNFIHTHCTDPRDYIFAFISLANVSCSVQPDYTKTVSRVFLESTTAMIQRTKTLNVICQSYNSEHSVSRPDRRSDEIIPSWVPDWSSRSSFETLISPQWDKTFKTSLNTKIGPHTFNPERPWLMRLRGVEIGSISNIFPRILTASADWKSEVLRWLPQLFDRIKYPTGEVVFDVVWRTLLKDRVRNSASRFPTGRIPKTEEHSYRVLFRDWYENTVDPINKRETEFLETTSSTILTDDTINMQVFAEALEKSLNECTIFISTTGYIGLTAGSAELGDRICVVFGAPVPLLLRYDGGSFRCDRTTEKSIWNILVGCAYVHGIMDGEVMEAMKRGEVKDEEIFLV
jgi:hypothetical protein